VVAARPAVVAVAAAKDALVAAVVREGTVQASCFCSRTGTAVLRRRRCNLYLCSQ
jgi:hypothetical protein